MGSCVCKAPNGEQVDQEFKLIVVGAPGVGKTSMVKRYCLNTFSEEEVEANNSDNFKVQYSINDTKRIKLQIWDTDGQERFRQMSFTYYKAANAALLVFDLNALKSFEQLDIWLHELERFSEKIAENNLLYFVIGNKNDLNSVVSKELIDKKNYQL